MPSAICFNLEQCKILSSGIELTATTRAHLAGANIQLQVLDFFGENSKLYKGHNSAKIYLDGYLPNLQINKLSNFELSLNSLPHSAAF